MKIKVLSLIKNAKLTKVTQQELINLKTKQRERKNVNMKNKKMNNKGFSLVELIIVIAIMAVLVGVLAPAYLRYVEKSRKSADVQAMDAVMSAMEAAAIDPSLNFGTEKTMEVVLSKNPTTIKHGQNDINTDPIDIELTETIGDYKLKSNDWTSVTITGTVEGGQVKFTTNPAYPEGLDNQKKISGYAPDLAAKLGLSNE